MKYAYIQTFGCQMNKADSEHMFGLLDKIDYKPVENINEADLVIFNTCTIRETANKRLYGHLGIAACAKKKNPNLLIGLGGCVAQGKRDWLQKKFPYIDFVFGTNNIYNLPEIVRKAECGKKICEIEAELPYELPEFPVVRQTKVTAWVNVILGCNFNCTYCIVPHVRGKEKSRRPENILKEVKELAEEGYKEIILLGQNVTAYGYDLASNYSKEKAVFGYIPEEPEYSLAKLLRLVHEVKDIERIRFLTGHPFHVTEELIDTVRELPKVCELFHVPMQAGDDTILKKMARVYTVEKYKNMIEKIKTKIPKSYITSDFIVGFPGETKEQFMNTVKAVQEIEFDACITTAYSPRPGTPSAVWEEQVPEKEKKARLIYLNSAVNEILEKKNKKYLGTIQEILVEGESEKNKDCLTGKTRGNQIVNFNSVEALHATPLRRGKLVNVKITRTKPWALFGELVMEKPLGN